MSYIEIPDAMPTRKEIESIVVGTYVSIDLPLRGWRRLWARIIGKPLTVRRLYEVKHSVTVGPMPPIKPL